MKSSTSLVLIILTLSLGLFTFSQCAPIVELTTLPDFDYTASKIYSGYLKVTEGKQLHYLLQESENKPDTDRLLVWLNGGPGCSSMLGWGDEHGPMSFNEEGTGFTRNEFSWNKNTNVLYIESPAGVGFSIAKNKEDATSDDYRSSYDNLTALLSFFEKFPEYKNRELYLSGESYAGIYIPYFATRILDYNLTQPTATKVNLKGILIGNGVSDWNVDTTPAYIHMAYDFGLYSPEIAQNLETCATDPSSASCIAGQIEFSNATTGINIYNIYGKCPPTNSSKTAYNYTPWVGNYEKYMEIQKAKKEFNSKTSNTIKTQKASLKMNPPCVVTTNADTYLNRADVKKALHVDPSITWTICSGLVSSLYTRDKEHGSYYLMPRLINSGLRILIFSGDTDGAVSFYGTKQWISNLKLDVLKPWRSWKVDEERISGYITQYRGLDFVTVRGAGHMVPQYKRPEATHMFESWINGNDL